MAEITIKIDNKGGAAFFSLVAIAGGIKFDSAGQCPRTILVEILQKALGDIMGRIDLDTPEGAPGDQAAGPQLVN